MNKLEQNRIATWWPTGESGWTWGQYGVFRVLFSSYLLVHFWQLMPWSAELFSNAGMLPIARLSPLVHAFPNLLAVLDDPLTVAALVGSGVLASVLLMVGRHDRIAAVWLWFLLACLFGRNPLIANPSMPVIGWLLLFHALLPGRRALSEGSSTVPAAYIGVAWFMLSVAYSYSGWTKLWSDAWVHGETVRWVLQNPLARDHGLRELLLATPDWLLQTVTYVVLYVELLFAPLALFKRLRPWLWGIMLGVQFGFLTLLNFADLTIPMLLLHMLTFDPRWLERRQHAGEKATLYYDGDCGFCHGWVRFLLSEDRDRLFQFAPMQAFIDPSATPDGSGRYISRQGSGARIRNTDDFESMIVETSDGQRLLKTEAARYILERLPGLWRVAAVLLRFVPAIIADRLYDVIARHRKRLARNPSGLCPVVPSEFRDRFSAGNKVIQATPSSRLQSEPQRHPALPLNAVSDGPCNSTE